MSAESSSKMAAEETSIGTLLAELRVSPPSNTDLDPILSRLTSYLLSLPASPSGELHWFCDKASETTREAATFLLRLHAYDSEEVKRWKEMGWGVVVGCYKCAGGHEEAKRRSRTTCVLCLGLWCWSGC